MSYLIKGDFKYRDSADSVISKGYLRLGVWVLAYNCSGFKSVKAARSFWAEVNPVLPQDCLDVYIVGPRGGTYNIK
jgi:hypothetical protein